MPYTADSLPAAVKALPEHAQEIWLAAFNAAYEQYDGDEETCNRVAWAAVKEKYEKQDGDWFAKNAEDDELETVDIPGVEILAVGKWNGSQVRMYTKETLQNIAKSFKSLLTNGELNYEPPLKLGHDEKQKLIQESGYPSIGWVSALKVKGDKLVADFKDVPKRLAEVIKAGGYKKVSSELYFDYKIGGKTWPAVLKAVSLLGADVPAVKTIADICAMYHDGDSETPEVVVYMRETENAEAISLDDLMSELDRVIEAAEPSIKAKPGAPAIRTYLREVKAKLRALIAKAQRADNEESLDAKVRQVRDAWYQAMTPGDSAIPMDVWVRDVYETHVIVEEQGELYSVPYTTGDDGVAFGIDSKQKVELKYVPVQPIEESSAGEPANANNEEDNHMREAIGKLLGLPGDATEDQVLEAVQSLKGGETLAENEGLKAKLAEAEDKLQETHIAAAIDKYVADGKLTPAQVDAAKAAMRKDEEGFTALMENQPRVVELGERGTDGDNADPTAELSENDRKVAAALGVDLKDFAAARETEKGVS